MRGLVNSSLKRGKVRGKKLSKKETERDEWVNCCLECVLRRNRNEALGDNQCGCMYLEERKDIISVRSKRTIKGSR